MKDNSEAPGSHSALLGGNLDRLPVHVLHDDDPTIGLMKLHDNSLDALAKLVRVMLGRQSTSSSRTEDAELNHAGYQRPRRPTETAQHLFGPASPGLESHIRLPCDPFELGMMAPIRSRALLLGG